METIETFNPIELRDRVVTWMFFEETVRAEQVEAARERWKEMQAQGEATALWRVLARVTTRRWSLRPMIPRRRV